MFKQYDKVFFYHDYLGTGKMSKVYGTVTSSDGYRVWAHWDNGRHGWMPCDQVFRAHGPCPMEAMPCSK